VRHTQGYVPSPSGQAFLAQLAKLKQSESLETSPFEDAIGKDHDKRNDGPDLDFAHMLKGSTSGSRVEPLHHESESEVPLVQIGNHPDSPMHPSMGTF